MLVCSVKVHDTQRQFISIHKNKYSNNESVKVFFISLFGLRTNISNYIILQPLRHVRSFGSFLCVKAPVREDLARLLSRSSKIAKKIIS